MLDSLPSFFIQWVITSLSLWVASHVFKGLRFADTGSLVVAALLLGFANAVLRPLLFVLTLPLTVLTLGIFVLVLNALMLMLVSALVKGFQLSGFWTAFFASMFIGVLSFLLSMVLSGGDWSWQAPVPMHAPGTGQWL
jgi:putative membrane protein